MHVRTICLQNDIGHLQAGKNSVYVMKTDVQKFVNCCRKYGILIFGIEGFIIEGEKIIPIDSLNADFSSEPDALQSCDDADRFLKNDACAQATHFDFVIE